MRIGLRVTLSLTACMIVAHAAMTTDASAAQARKLHATSEKTATGFAFPESVAYDPAAKVLYVSQFGGTEPKPAEKDGKGKISKVSLDGKVMEEQFLPAPGGEALNKPKGIWVKGDRLWVTDIDAVWIFDLKTRKGRKLALPGIQFANDPAVKGNVLYVSDNRADQLFRVEPADFLNAKGDPKVTKVFSGKGVYPNGLYPAKDGSLLMAGMSDKEARGLYSLTSKGDVKPLSKEIGRLDGLYQMNDGTILATDWNTGSLFSWTPKGGMVKLASDFKGPADFCVVPEAKGFLVVVPDLPKSELRLVHIAR